MNKDNGITQIQFVTTTAHLRLDTATAHHLHTWRRQLSAERFAANNIRFCFGDDNLEHCDYCVVYGYLPSSFKLTLPRHKLIFVAPEPPILCFFPEVFLAQFGTVITSDRDTPHPNRLFMQGGLPWHIGLYSGINKLRPQPMTIGTFRTYTPVKHKLVSVVCSDKENTEQRRKRVSFVARLREHFGDRLDVFGKGINTFVDKEEVLAPYRYHIVLENCDVRDYWSEKISDPLLALTYPIYWGCENLEDYLPRDCFTRIDIARPDEAIGIIESVITSDKDKESQDALRHARNLILDEHNMFELVAKVVLKLQSSPPSGNALLVRLRPQSYFKRRGLHRAAWVFKHYLKQYRASLRQHTP